MAHAVVDRVWDEPAAATEFRADYWDCFRLTPAHPESARNWASLSLRGAETSRGAFAHLVWGGLLGFNLAPRGAENTLAGWHISAEAPARVVLDIDGALMAGRMVFETSENAVTWTTMLRYRSFRGRVIWAATSKVHRTLVPRCLLGAHVAMSRSRTADQQSNRGPDFGRS